MFLQCLKKRKQTASLFLKAFAKKNNSRAEWCINIFCPNCNIRFLFGKLEISKQKKKLPSKLVQHNACAGNNFFIQNRNKSLKVLNFEPEF